MKKTKAVKIILPAIILICGIALIIWYFASNGGPYSDYTGRATGTVMSCTQTRWAQAEDESDEFELEVRYTAGGKEYTNPRLAAAAAYAEGEQIELAYHPDDPALSVPRSAVEGSFVMVIVGAVLCLLAIAAFVTARRKKPSEDSSDQPS